MSDAIDQLEMSIIGAVLLRPENLAVLPTLEVDDFQGFRAKATWTAIRNLEAAHSPIDTTTVGDELEKMGSIDQVGFDWLGNCVLMVPSITSAIEYARRLKDHALRFRLMESLDDIRGAAKRGEMTGAEMLSAIIACTSRLDAEQPEDACAIGPLTQRRLKDIERQFAERESGQRTLTGFNTGIDELDEKLGGWQPGIVSIVAARPGMGKSSLGLATADACSSRGFGVHLFSLEDTEAAYADRTMARVSKVPSQQIRNLAMNRGEMGALQDAMRNLARRKGWLFDGRSGITAEEVVRSVRRRKKDNQTRVVIVDYIQLLKKPTFRMSTHEALGESITTLADAAKADGIAYVVMSQLNRDLEKREDRRPQLSDLRESGSLEERSKCVVGVYRGAAYKLPPKRNVDFDCDCNPTPKGDCNHTPSDDQFKAQVQLHILKNSNGPTGCIDATWHGPTTRIS
jgi:replicative DNA helicase